MRIPLTILLVMIFTISAIPVFSQYPITYNANEPIPEIQSSNEIDQKIPDWIKNDAKRWIDNSIDDQTFVNGIQFLIKENNYL